MVKKDFFAPDGYLHAPIMCGKDPSEDSYYVKIMSGETLLGEVLLALAAKDEPFLFYAPIDIKRYGVSEVTLCCESGFTKPCKNLFDGIIAGKDPLEEKALYPDLYNEEVRQQIHFSAKCGWLNDPNGCFYKDGLYHLYFQHSPYLYHHNTVNMSWGHAISRDGVHFTEIGDAIMPDNTFYNVASGSAIVDEYNISGLGCSTVIAAHTDLTSERYFNSGESAAASRQHLLFSTDNGYSFTRFENSPFLASPSGEYWRDPKLLFIDDKTLCVALWETRESIGCISFYKTNDCKNWEFCSSIMGFYECPDLFPLKCEETGEELWVLYGGNGAYYVGSFDNFTFTPIEKDLYLDYGDSVYAAQTFNNIGGKEKRYHIGWLFDKERMVNGDTIKHGDVPYKQVSSSQSMSLITELSLHKTSGGYRVFRRPTAALKALRACEKNVALNGQHTVSSPLEWTFAATKDFTLRFGKDFVEYSSQSGRLTTSAGLSYTLSKSGTAVRVFFDTRSVEVFINDEFAASFSYSGKEAVLQSEEKIIGTQFSLKSIWATN